ncbi:MAG: hypothetical protein JNK48_24760 [Bryobacterales bacterium]|nr:hypothetical protein [Bryobacterales bacterium]
MAKRTPKAPDSGKKVRRIARNVIGVVPAEKVFQSKADRKKPKHKKPVNPDE